MSHLALYREFRPKTFDDVIAQNHITQTLRHQVQNGTFSHAYLFCGTRGTGKTSCAKIFAKAVNCLHPKNGSPCGECEVCKKIDANGNFDIMEIDAASNNRVDEIRDLREKVNYLPSVGKYKVYIIDEVHMLTDSAFNALLKTLEEPPSHIIFILATTEPEKLPATILSRCMRFDFRLVEIKELVNQLKKVFTASNVTFDEKALELIAKAGNGSVRDSLSVAEMCMAYLNNNITYDGVQQCLGLTDDETLFEIAKSIAENNGGKLLKSVEELYNEGKNITTLLSDLCDFFKNVLTLKLAKNYNLNVPQNLQEYYSVIATQCDETRLLDILKNLADSLSQIKYSYNQKVFVEVTLLGLLYNENIQLDKLTKRLETLEKSILNDTNYHNNLLDNNGQSVTELSIHKSQENQKNQSDTLSQVTSINSEKVSHGNAVNPKSIFGDLIGYIRSHGEMLLCAGLVDVLSVEIVNKEFIMYCKTEDIKNLIDDNKSKFKDYLNQKYGINNIKAVLFVDGAREKENQLKDMLNNKVEIKD